MFEWTPENTFYYAALVTGLLLIGTYFFLKRR